jgi:hypothetical protein
MKGVVIMCNCKWEERYRLAMKEIENNMNLCYEKAIKLDEVCVNYDDYERSEAYRHRANAYSNALITMKTIIRAT